jgi:hypothetical protein
MARAGTPTAAARLLHKKTIPQVFSQLLDFVDVFMALVETVQVQCTLSRALRPEKFLCLLGNLVNSLKYNDFL